LPNDGTLTRSVYEVDMKKVEKLDKVDMVEEVEQFFYNIQYIKTERKARPTKKPNRPKLSRSAPASLYYTHK